MFAKKNPGVNRLANSKNKTFKTNLNNPKVKKLIGQVKKLITGFIVEFIIAKIIVKIIKAIHPE